MILNVKSDKCKNRYKEYRMFHWKKLRQKVEVTTMASFDQKLRTLYLMEILLERTDDEHMLNILLQ